METPGVSSKLIGAIFVERGLVSQETLDEALATQEREGGLLGEILVSKFGVSRLALAGAIAEQWADLEQPPPEEEPATERPASPEAPQLARGGEHDAGNRRPLGEIFVEQGMITEQELADALEQQRVSGDRLGEILVARGVISRLELASALADQWSSLQKLRPPEPKSANGDIGADGELDQLPHPPDPLLAERLSELENRLHRLEDVDASELRANMTGRMDALAATLVESESRLQEALAAVETARAEGARRLGELAGEMPPLAADVEHLRHRVDRVEGRTDEEDIRARLDGLARRLEELAVRPEWDPSADADLRSRLQAVESRDDSELRDRLAAAESRSDDIRSWLAEVAEQLRALEGRSDSDIRDRLEELTRHVQELAARPVADPGLRARVDAVEARSDEELRFRLEGLSHRVEEVAARPIADPDLAARLEAVENRSDHELRERLAAVESRSDDDIRSQLVELGERLRTLESRPDRDVRPELEEVARRVRELADRPLADPELAARVEAVEARSGEELSSRLAELAGRVDALAAHRGVDPELIARLAAVEARSGEELSSRLAELAGRVDALAAHQGVDPELTARLAAVEARSDEDIRSWLGDLARRVQELAERPAGDRELAARVEAVEARSDEELRRQIFEAHEQIAELTARPVADTSLPGRLGQIEARLEDLVVTSEDRLGEAFGAFTAGADELRAAAGELRPGLHEAMRRLEALEVGGPRLEAIEQRLAEVVDTRAENESVAALWRAVDGLRGRVEQALGLLGQAGARLEQLEAEARAGLEHVDTVHVAQARVEPVEAEPAMAHILFVPNVDGYELVDGEGAPPRVGDSVDVSLADAALVVNRVGRSPLPGDARPCAFLERVPD